MNVPTFIEINENEQCQELREYFIGIGASIPHESSDNFISDLSQIISVCDTCFKTDESAESVLNSIVSVLIQVPPQNSAQLIAEFCDRMTKVPNHKWAQIVMRVLQNLFGGVGAENPLLRYRIYVTLVRLSADHVIVDDIAKLKQWFPVSIVGTDRIQALLRLLIQQHPSAKLQIELLSTYTEENASQARDDAHKCIVSVLSDANTFLMDHLLALKPVKFLEGEAIHDLLTIFVSEKLNSYVKFYTANREFVESLGLSHEHNLQKMRLLTFMQMAENRKEIPFEAIQSDLQLNADQIESFVIDVLRTKLVKAKVDQLQRRVLVSSTMHRTFGRAQWQQLRDTLGRWHHNLGHSQRTIQAAVHSVETVV